MADQWTRTTGLVAILGGVLTVIVNVPSDWYGAGPRDSYLFDPAVFSPLWIHRVLVPALSVLAGLGLLVGLLGLIRRDWSRSGRSRRWGGVLGIIGLAMVTLTIPVIVPTSTSTGDAVLFTLVALLTLVLGLLVLGLGLLLLAYGYSQTTRPRLGYAFIGVIVGIPAFNFISPDVLGSLLAMTPVGVVWILIGLELIDHPTPSNANDPIHRPSSAISPIGRATHNGADGPYRSGRLQSDPLRPGLTILLAIAGGGITV